MPINMRQSSFGRLSAVCLAAATGCWVFLLLPGDRRGVLTFFTPEDFEDHQVVAAILKNGMKWSVLPGKTREKILQANLDRVIRRFTSEVVSSMEAAAGLTVSRESYCNLTNAIRDALGPDIVVEPLGSRTRRTAAVQDNDLDFQVRRSRESGRRNEPFTDDDKESVKQNLEKLPCVTGNVTVGRVAIKFVMETSFEVDLVLWRPRQEEFPRLRGGDDFYENSARINEFLEQYPAARAAIIGVKSIQIKGRPKGLLLEAIAWRLSKTCPFQLTRTDRVFAGSEEEAWKLQTECFNFFRHVMDHLADWEASPFGDDLKADLALQPERKQEEHIQRFAKLRSETGSELSILLVVDILRTAQEKWTEQNGRHGPLHLYLERQLAEFWFFPFDY